MRHTAEKADIAVQTEVMAGALAPTPIELCRAAAGIPCALVSIPLRNMHTAVEVVSLSDVEQTGRLLAEYAKGGICHA